MLELSSARQSGRKPGPAVYVKPADSTFTARFGGSLPRNVTKVGSPDSHDFGVLTGPNPRHILDESTSNWRLMSRAWSGFHGLARRCKQEARCRF